mmetsp:Transcript_21511/g.55009  ORF Transcript_21511/g.55009 Transcript_21511/m.55009 type:complete len:364 (+) Transcript_21511:1187-2278(+)
MCRTWRQRPEATWLCSELPPARQRHPAVCAVPAALRHRLETLPGEWSRSSSTPQPPPLAAPRGIVLPGPRWGQLLGLQVADRVLKVFTTRSFLRQSPSGALRHPKGKKRAGRTSTSCATRRMLASQFPGRRPRHRDPLSGGLRPGRCLVPRKMEVSFAVRPTGERRPPRGPSPPRSPASPAGRSGALRVDIREQTEGPSRGRIPKLSDNGRRRSPSRNVRPGSRPRPARRTPRPRGRSPSLPRAPALFQTPPRGGAPTTAPPACPRPGPPRLLRQRRAGARPGGARRGATGRPCGHCGRSRARGRMTGGAWVPRRRWQWRARRVILCRRRGHAHERPQTRRGFPASPRRRSLGPGRRRPTRQR